MSRATVYLDTSVVSYLVAGPTADAVNTARVTATREWWATIRPKTSVVVYSAVIAEISAGAPDMAAKRLAVVSDIAVLASTVDIERLTDLLLRKGLVPPKAAFDAAHLAFASCHEVDFLLTWNYRHLANPFILRQVRKLLLLYGRTAPEVITPEQMLKGFEL